MDAALRALKAHSDRLLTVVRSGSGEAELHLLLAERQRLIDDLLEAFRRSGGPALNRVRGQDEQDKAKGKRQKEKVRDRSIADTFAFLPFTFTFPSDHPVHPCLNAGSPARLKSQARQVAGIRAYGSTELAVRYLEAALSLDPDDHAAHNDLAAVLSAAANQTQGVGCRGKGEGSKDGSGFRVQGADKDTVNPGPRTVNRLDSLHPTPYTLNAGSRAPGADRGAVPCFRYLPVEPGLTLCIVRPIQ
jgi:hypothetical protein